MDAVACLRADTNGALAWLDLPDGSRQAIHPLWLRERARGPAQIDPLTQQRLYNPAELDPALRILAITPAGTDGFDATFSDGCTSHIRLADILAELPGGQDHTLPAALPWQRDDPGPAAHDWRDCDAPAAQYRALTDYLAHGYIIITNVPAEHSAVLQVGRRFGFVRATNFGALFDVRSVPQATDLAYTPLPLDPHTDNPYRDPVPGIQLLHCLVNETPGGLSTLVDGLAVAEALRVEAPEALAVLSRTQLRFRYVDSSTDLQAWASPITLDAAGHFTAIHYSPRLDFAPLLSPDELAAFYAARRLLDTMLRSDRFERRFRLENGDLMMFDNRRLLHGRTGFDPRTGLRHLQGCYIDADGPASQYRVLRRSLA